MARIRTIKPGFFTDEHLSEVSPLARLLFIGLMTLADRDGRLEDRPKRIMVETMPYDECDVDSLLNELSNHAEKFIIRYESKNGDKLIQIRTFLKHQRPHHTEAKSVLPPCDNSELTVKQRLTNRPATLGREGKGKEGKGIPQPPKETPRPDGPLTNIQSVVEAYKQEKGISKDDAAWNKAHFPRFSKSASALLAATGALENALSYLKNRGAYLNQKKMEWTLETIARNAADLAPVSDIQAPAYQMASTVDQEAIDRIRQIKLQQETE